MSTDSANKKVKGELDSGVVAAVEETQSKENTRKINALKNLQVDITRVEAKFYEDLHQLECKYAQLYEPFYEKRKLIVTGKHEPTDEEAKWAYGGAEEGEDKENGSGVENVNEAELSEHGKQLLKDLKAKFEKNAIPEQGVESFWYGTLRSFRMTSEMIEEHDEPILHHLQDIRVRLFAQKPYGFALDFHFSENPYFTNSVLTKTYYLKFEVDPKDPLSFDGPDLERTEGCTIDWKAGKNVTVKQVKKKLKARNKKAPARVITKEEKQESFFHFFETPKGQKAAGDEENKQVAVAKKGGETEEEDDDENDEEMEEDEAQYALMADFEIGEFIKEKVVPRATEYFTGEAFDSEFEEYDDEEGDDDDEDDEDDDDDEEDDDEEDDDEEENGGKKGGKKQLAIKGGKPGKKGPKGGEPTPSECKQN